MDITKGKNAVVLWTILVLSIAGFIDATYLAMKKLIGSPVTCYAFNGCGTVDSSPFSSLLGIPLSVFGSIFYAITIVLLVQYFLRKQKMVLYVAAGVLIFGALFSIYLLVLQAFFIKAWCFYCIISDTIGIINAILIIYFLKKEKILK